MKKTILILSIVFISIIAYSQPPAFQGLDISSNETALVYGNMQILGVPAETGDWIAAFDEQENLVGAAEVTFFGGQGLFLITLYGGADQLATNEMFTLRGWDSSSSTYYQKGDPEEEFGPWMAIPGGGYLDDELYGPADNGDAVFIINFDNILPIELSEFGLQKRSCDIFKIEWVTDTEINNEYFSIQRSIDDIYSFETIEKIDGAGNSNSERSYTYEDELGLKGNHNIYYRLKQTDYDGKSSYSNIISAKIDCENENRLTAFPNPFSNELTMNVENAKDSQIIVFDAQGKVITDTQVSDASSIKISTIEWPEGLYIARHLQNGEVIESQKIIKQN